ncbi:MAG: deoxyguanosinetriphosphate triphosphohydrolase [Alphaproteobacteria bacterium]|nr:deoxyguanosinetriphosphate triphosphohydrolase [Alphaproteobacteria bacterium]
MTTKPERASLNYCALPLAAYACRPDRSKGRLHQEPESAYRTPFQRDRDRIVHASAFRRLKGKTQVFVAHEGDEHRTRLTHTLEVAQIARTLARALLVNEDLAETVALSHDLGHPPFGHIGESALDSCMAAYGGFDHNDYSLRIVTLLERKYPGWPGLNLTWETLEGIVKHNGPVTGPLPVTLAALREQTDLRLETYAGVEAQIAAVADDITYNNHDVEDGLAAGLFTIGDLETVPLLAGVMATVRKAWPDLTGSLFVHETIRTMIGTMVGDVFTEAKQRLNALDPGDPDDVRQADQPLVAFSDSMLPEVNALRRFLKERMYAHADLTHKQQAADHVIPDLFSALMADSSRFPENWQRRANDDPFDKARLVADYIAGMTDAYALREWKRVVQSDDIRLS